jgi:hypothetical protein
LPAYWLLVVDDWNNNWGAPYYSEGTCKHCNSRTIISNFAFRNDDFRHNCAKCGVMDMAFLQASKPLVPRNAHPSPGKAGYVAIDSPHIDADEAFRYGEAKSRFLTEAYARLRSEIRTRVRRHPEPETVTLTGFDIDWEKLCGTFEVCLDSTKLSEPYSFAVEANGRPRVEAPVIDFRDGLRRSYLANFLTEATNKAVLRALESCVPRIRAYGLERVTGIETDARTPLAMRILDLPAFEQAKATVHGDFRFSVRVRGE